MTGAERKAFAAEVGRLIAKLAENCQNIVFAIGKDESSGNWVDDLAKTSGTPVKTIYNWWSAFTKSAGLDMTPKQAGEAEKGLFFVWLDEQKAKEDAEKTEKIAQVASISRRGALALFSVRAYV